LEYGEQVTSDDQDFIKDTPEPELNLSFRAKRGSLRLRAASARRICFSFSETGKGAAIRLLGRERIATLLLAVDLFAKQSGCVIQVRSAPHFHDRYVFVDRSGCYQSGASFKDGAKSALTTLTQITDAFAAMLQTYETIWSKAKVER
jgi:hypothetical protein